MLDVRVLRDTPDVVRASQAARSEDVTLVDRAIAADAERRAAALALTRLVLNKRTLAKPSVRCRGK